MNRFVNLSLLRNPWNWASVGSMIILILAGAFVVYTHLNSDPTGTPASGALQKEV